MSRLITLAETTSSYLVLFNFINIFLLIILFLISGLLKKNVKGFPTEENIKLKES